MHRMFYETIYSLYIIRMYPIYYFVYAVSVCNDNIYYNVVHYENDIITYDI